MTTSKQEKIETFMVQLETLMDLHYEIRKEIDYCNHLYVIKTLRPGYDASKKLFRQSLEELLDNNSES